MKFLLSTYLAQIKYEGLPHAAAGQGQINTIVDIAFSVAGALALLFIIIGGLRYIFSAGDPQAASQAKNTVIYALVGLVVTILAYSIVRFVAKHI